MTSPASNMKTADCDAFRYLRRNFLLPQIWTDAASGNGFFWHIPRKNASLPLQGRQPRFKNASLPLKGRQPRFKLP